MIFDFGSEKDVESFISKNNQELMIYLIPVVNTYKKLHFTEIVEVYLILENADVMGRQFYFLSLENTWINRDISFFEYSLAFVKDALFYPIAIVMMGNWGH